MEELYAGHIYPAERIVPRNPEYRPLNRKISDLREALQKKLPEADDKSLETLLGLCDESSAMEAFASFRYGFMLGALIMLDVMAGKEELVR